MRGVRQLFLCSFVGLCLPVFGLDIQRTNELIVAGKFAEAANHLQAQKQGASISDIVLIEGMLTSLSRYRASRENRAGESAEETSQEDLTPAVGRSDAGAGASAQSTGLSRPPRIIALGGYNNCWYLASSYTSPYGRQVLFMSKTWPEQDIKRFNSSGFVITAAAGDSAQWAVIMSQYKDGSDRKQYCYGPAALDERAENWIGDALRKGYHITSVAGFGKEWVVVVTSGMGWGRQRFTLPNSYKHSWMQSRMDEGYHITAAAGDHLREPDGSTTDTYLFVATQGTGWGAQLGHVRTSREKLVSLAKEKKATMAPTAFVGFKETPGVFLAGGTPFGSGWGYILGGSNETLSAWVKSQRVEEPDP